MDTRELVQEIDRLPFEKKIFVMEEILKSIKRDKVSNLMQKAAEQLYGDYVRNSELTAFLALDTDDFYEAR